MRYGEPGSNPATWWGLVESRVPAYTSVAFSRMEKLTIVATDCHATVMLSPLVAVTWNDS